MNCAYHIHNAATASCNGCGKPLCAACDHRIKGFPYCQDCIVCGIDLLREQRRSPNYVPYVKKETSPIVATLLSVIPGLGAAYNGQTTKAVVYFAVWAGLLQMAILTKVPLFVLGFFGMWAFAGLDAFRTARAIRSGVTPDAAADILVSRFAGNPKLWGVILVVLGASFLLQRFLNVGAVMRAVLPVVLIGLGAYILRGYIFKTKAAPPGENLNATDFSLANPSFRNSRYDLDANYASRSKSGGWRDR